MKLAEALQERADLNKKIEQLRSRITSNALMQEGQIWQLYQTVNCCQICLQSVMF